MGNAHIKTFYIVMCNDGRRMKIRQHVDTEMPSLKPEDPGSIPRTSVQITFLGKHPLQVPATIITDNQQQNFRFHGFNVQVSRMYSAGL